uniref:Uncharacterized protein n=1 Tax=Neovison vison TaxID=452646 RepID=A0A8C7ATP8_NEOVI
MTSLASALFCYSGLAAMFILAGFGVSRVMDSQASMCVSLTLPLRLSHTTYLCLHPSSCPQLPRLLRWKVRLSPGCPDIRLALSLSGRLAQPRGLLLQLPLRTLHGHTRVNSPCWFSVPSWWSYTLVEKMNEHT